MTGTWSRPGRCRSAGVLKYDTLKVLLYLGFKMSSCAALAIGETSLVVACENVSVCDRDIDVLLYIFWIALFVYKRSNWMLSRPNRG